MRDEANSVFFKASDVAAEPGYFAGTDCLKDIAVYHRSTSIESRLRRRKVVEVAVEVFAKRDLRHCGEPRRLAEDLSVNRKPITILRGKIHLSDFFKLVPLCSSL